MRTRALLLAITLIGSASPILAQVPFPPTTPRFLDITRLAQDGYGDSARTLIAKIVAATTPTDASFPEALYTSASVARLGADSRRDYARVLLDYPLSAWADKSLLRLAQLDYGNGDTEGVVARVTRLFTDYPGSPAIPTGALWGARAAFERSAPQVACDWLTRGIAATTDIEERNQLAYLKLRCNVGDGVRLAKPADDSLRAKPPVDSGRLLRNPPVDSLRAKPPVVTPPPPPPVATVPPKATATPKSQDLWHVQVAAITDKAMVKRVMTKLKAAGFTGYQVAGPKNVVKVQAGPFATRDAAKAAIPKLKALLGGAPFAVPNP